MFVLKGILRAESQEVILAVKSICLSAVNFTNIGLTYIDIVQNELNKLLSGCIDVKHMTG